PESEGGGPAVAVRWSGDKPRKCAGGCAAAGSPAQGAPRGLLFPRPDRFGLLSRGGGGGLLSGSGSRALLSGGGGRGGGYVALDVDAPASQLGRESGVLALLADGQRQLTLGHDHLGGAGRLLHRDVAYLGRAQALG